MSKITAIQNPAKRQASSEEKAWAVAALRRAARLGRLPRKSDFDPQEAQRIKDYLAHENERQGRKVTQKEFVIGLIEDALERWEQETADADPGAPTDTLDPIDEPADSAPSWEAEETEGGAKNVAE